jgi:phosphoribosylformimino-5-aminoimidazole carboxamide ribotide isomerase
VAGAIGELEEMETKLIATMRCGLGGREEFVRLIPVLDVLRGVVVRGVGGRRSEYKPVVSRLTSSTEPLQVARALVDAYRPTELYLADLDAIAGARAAVQLYQSIRDLGVRLWVDAGIRDGRGAQFVADAGCDVIAGLETVPGPKALDEIVAAVGPDRVVFSLDLRDGDPLREWPDGGNSPADLPMAFGLAWRPVPTVVACGITRLIVLDLARVGGGAGTGTDDLCRQLATAYPQLEVIAGGGIAGPIDLDRLAACGVRGVLVASALHDGRITRLPEAKKGLSDEFGAGYSILPPPP